MAIQIRRGTNAQWEALKSNIVVGELATTYDSERAFLGTGEGTYFEMANIKLIADEFDSSVSYAKGNVCIYQGKLYQFTANHSGAWSGTDVEQVTASEVGSGGTAISDLQDNALIHRTASGSIASFSDGSDMPVDSLIADINPVQSGSGDPSPTNVRPISGWDSVDVNVRGKNSFGGLTQSETRASASVDYSTGTFRATATSSGNNAQIMYTMSRSAVKQFLGKSVTFSIQSHSETTGNMPYVAIYKNSSTIVGRLGAVGAGIVQLSTTFTVESDTESLLFVFRINQGACNVDDYLELNGVMFCLASESEDFAPYNGTTTTVNLGRTVYGGTLNVTTGVLTMTMGYIASYNGESLPSTWISDRDVYASGTIPTTGAQVAYTLATPTTVQLTPTQVQTLLGQNNVWADSGDVEVTYTANASLTIEEIINAITALGGNV